MHLLIPFAAALSPACSRALETLDLPRLAHLVGRLAASGTDTGDEYSLTPPHERALGHALGMTADDGCLPWAARQAHADGIAVGDAAWGLLTPVHWRVGRDDISLADPDALQLGEDESRACIEAVRGLFESEGFRLVWAAPLRWYASHETLADLPCASIDRVIGRNVDLWLAADARARLIRRLQNEVQMLLYTHALNDARDAAGALTVNSFWLSGCGRLAPGSVAPADPAPQVEAALRAPALAENWADWAAAWREIDAGPLDNALRRAIKSAIAPSIASISSRTDAILRASEGSGEV